jgi:phosphohistidine phosphatase SixA
MIEYAPMKRLTILLLLSGLFVSAAAAQPAIFIVRHAEKATDGGNDPDLSQAGHGRAARLANMLRDARISAIFVTEFKRTQQTAASLATMLNLDPKIVPANNTSTLIAKLRGSAVNVLVVGHSNTIPELIRGLGIKTPPIQIADQDYDNLFVVVRGARPGLLRLHYR